MGEELCLTCARPAHDLAALPSDTYRTCSASTSGTVALRTTKARSHRLQIALDTAYPGIIDEVSAAVATIRGRLPYVRHAGRGEQCVTVNSSWTQWLCHFPQHGPGRKHHRKIELADRQQTHVDAAPGMFLGGLIQTDGWRGANRVHVKGKDYAYPRYQFSNRSDDIRRLFTDTCDAMGIRWRPWGQWHISVARRDDVARLDEFVGLKA
jgi:hypothetical protein